MSRSISMRGVVGAVMLLTVALGAARAEAAQGDRQTEINARQAFAAARYDEAIELFAKLYAESLNPIYLRNIGRCHQKKREPEKAIDAFQDYLAKGKGITSSERKEIQGYIQEMEQLRDANAKQAQAANQPATPPPPANPPPTTVQPVSANGTAPPPSTLALGAPPPPYAEGGQPMTIENRTAEEPGHPFYTRWWFWTVVGVVAAGAVVTALVLSSGTTRPDCPSSISCK